MGIFLETFRNFDVWIKDNYFLCFWRMLCTLNICYLIAFAGFIRHGILLTQSCIQSLFQTSFHFSFQPQIYIQPHLVSLQLEKRYEHPRNHFFTKKLHFWKLEQKSDFLKPTSAESEINLTPYYSVPMNLALWR